MTFVIDNLIAILVGTVLLGGLLVLQQRGQQSAVEATQRYRARAMASEFTSTLERELENVRSRAETERAFATAGGGSAGPDTYRFRILRAPSDRYTQVLEFPTAGDPNALSASGVVIVAYHVEPTGETVAIDGTTKPLYRATRYVYERGGSPVATGTYDRLLDFDVTALSDGGPTDEADELAESPPRISFALVFAPEPLAMRAADQAATPLTSVRYARTVRAAGAMAPAGTAPVDLAAAGGIPDFPSGPVGGASSPPTPQPGSEPADGSNPTPDPDPTPETEPEQEPVHPICRLLPFLC